MKTLTTLLLTLLVLGGCAKDYLITSAYEPVEDESLFLFHLSLTAKGLPNNPFASEQAKYQLGQDFLLELYTRPFNCFYDQVMSGDCLSDEKILRDNVDAHQRKMNLVEDKNNLSEKLKNWAVISNQLYGDKIEAINLRYQLIAQEKKRVLEEKLLARKNICRDYGFKDDTDGMGLCLIELDKLAKLEEQILAIEKRNNQVYLQNQQLIADQKRQREAQALINLGAAISGAGVPRTNTPKAPITTYPNSFSSSLTVPSNQVCPILSTPITKQEIRGANRICYYQ